MPVPEELQKLVGTIYEPWLIEVERGAIKRYADAIDDANPLYYDVEYARKGGYRDIVAPLGFYGWPVKGKGAIESLEKIVDLFAQEGYPGILDGGMEIEPFLPVCAGDILAAYAKVVDLYERSGKTGSMLFFILETSYLNQNGDMAAKTRITIIARPVSGE